MPTTTKEKTEKSAPTEYINNILELIDQRATEWHEQGHKRAKLSTGDLCAEVNLNYNTAKKNGVFHKLKNRYDSINYIKWKGVTLVIEDYLIERELIKPEQPEEDISNSEKNNE